MNTINLQAWLSATQVATVARYMEMSGFETRRLSAIVRVAVEVLGGVLTKKGIAFTDEVEAIHYLEKRGFPISTRRDKQIKIVTALQEATLNEVDKPYTDKLASIEALLEGETNGIS